MVQQRKKKTVEFHFIDMNDPNRYKKLKVTRACDYCRKRKIKCDIGVPNSGTCSNCKKTKHICIFSPIPSKTNNNITNNSTTTSTTTTSTSTTSVTTTIVPVTHTFENSLFSIDSKGICSFEKKPSVLDENDNHLLLDLPTFSKEFELNLIHNYFNQIHPYFPIVDKFYITNNINNLPNSLKFALLSISVYFSNIENAQLLSKALYYHATIQHDHSIVSILSVQTLFLLYKYQELVTPVASVSNTANQYLMEIQYILNQLESSQMAEEFICRARWILYIIMTLSNHLNVMMPSRLPLLTEIEHYDKVELNTICNLIQLINITRLFSQSLAHVSDQNSLFTSNTNQDTFVLLSNLNHWQRNLPSHMNENISYIWFIYDIINLMLSSIHHHQTNMSDLAMKITYRAQHLTQSKLATIQGNRMVAYGLTLACQMQSIYLKKFPENTQNYQTTCLLSFKILLKHLVLSDQFYLTIQSLQSRFETKEMHNHNDHHVINNPEYYQSPSLLVPQQENENWETNVAFDHHQNNYQGQEDWQQTNYYYDNHTNYSNNTTHLLPVTPTYEKEFTKQQYTTTNDKLYEPITPPISNQFIDSYFHSYASAAQNNISIASSSFSLFHPITIQGSKSCKNQQKIK